MEKHSQRRVIPFHISEGCTVSELVNRMRGTSFQARNLARGVEIWAQMLEGEVTIFLGLAGAMVPAGMRQVMAYLIENRLIDCLVSTGANLFHDLHESLGRFHWQGSATADDSELASSRVYRIHDVLASEEEFDETEEFVTSFSSALEERAYTTREYFFLLGRELLAQGKEEGILTAAARANLPIFCPAPTDSVFGTALALGRVRGGSHLLFDLVGDLMEIVQIACWANSSGVILIGGGMPKNFIQQIKLCGEIFATELKGHEYAIQITTDSPQWGGLSGCTFDEARSWRKVTQDAATVTINSDATIALPLMVSALSERSAAIKERKRPSFLLGRELIVG